MRPTTQFYDPLTNSWNEQILGAMGVPKSIFPAIIEPGTVIGDLSSWLRRGNGRLDIGIVFIAIVTDDAASSV